MSRAHSYSESRAHSPTFPSLHLRHNSFSNLSVALPTSQLILQPFRHFAYVTTHSPTLPPLYQRHSSFSNPSVDSPTSQFILQPFFCFSYVTSSSLNSPGESPMAGLILGGIEDFNVYPKTGRIIFVFCPVLALVMVLAC